MEMSRVNLSICLVSLCSIGVGCSNLAELAIHNLHNETAQDLDSCLEPVRDCLAAKAAWRDVVNGDPRHAYSAAYAEGFKDGYRDMIEEGGTGQPPPVPPSCYWDIRYQTPLGHAAIEDWYAGFRHGSSVARESGNRRWVIVPSSLEAPLLPNRDAKAPDGSVDRPNTLPELPPPRMVPKEAQADGTAKSTESAHSPVQGP
jgi:hypothetical protein